MPGPPPGTGRKPIRHGTNGGYVAHRRRGEKACLPCLDAHRDYQRAHVAAHRDPVLHCGCGNTFDTVDALMRHTLFHHRRPPTRAERTPRAAA